MSHGAPRVSILMPTRDQAAYLLDAVDSVIAQDFRDFELLVIDDGSTDASKDLVCSYEDPRIRYVWQSHAGVGAALNRGLTIARAAFVARLDADDVWLPHLLTRLVRVLEGNPSAAFVYARAAGMDASRRPTGDQRGHPPPPADSGYLGLLLGDCTCNIAMVIRRDCLVRVGGYDASLPSCEDWDVVLRLARDDEFVFVDEIVARYRSREGSLSGFQTPHFEAYNSARLAVVARHLSIQDAPSVNAGVAALARRNVAIEVTLRLWAVGRYREAAQSVRAVLASGAPRVAASGRLAWLLFRLIVVNRSVVVQGILARLARWRRSGDGEVGPRVYPAHRDIPNRSA